MQKILSTKKGGLLYIPNFYTQEQANYILDYIKIFQNPDKINQKVKGKLLPIPRKILYYGEKDYSYSNVTHKATGQLPKEFKKVLSDISSRFSKIKLIRDENFEKMNSCLINYYENENSSVAWHSDDEKELGPDNEKNILILSLSLGDKRDFKIRHKEKGIDFRIELDNGDLVVMYGNFQHEYEHCVPKAKCKKNLRVNLTYRVIL